MYTHIHIFIYMHINTCIHTCIYIHTCIHTYAHTCIYTCMHTHTHTHTHTVSYGHTDTRLLEFLPHSLDTHTDTVHSWFIWYVFSEQTVLLD